MRNLILFISKYSYFFLFLLFEVLAFYLLFLNNNFQASEFLNSTNAISGNIYKSYSNFTDYVNLKEINASLAKENNALRKENIKSYTPLFANKILVEDTIKMLQYEYTEAKVINNSINKQRNYLSLDVGSRDGIEVGMGVIGPQGAVGVIKNVSESYAVVLSLLHSSAKLSVKLKKSQYFGSMQWDGKSYREGILEDIPNHVGIKLGDTIVTSGYSAIFPEGIEVATISEFEEIDGENFYGIRAKYVNDFKNLSYVYVVNNMMKLELNKLEQEVLENND